MVESIQTMVFIGYENTCINFILYFYLGSRQDSAEYSQNIIDMIIHESYVETTSGAYRKLPTQLELQCFYMLFYA